MDKRKARFCRSIIIALDITHIAGFRKLISFGQKLDVFILLQEVISVALDIFDQTGLIFSRDLKVFEECLDVTGLAVADDIKVVAVLFQFLPCFKYIRVKRSAVFS